jgi:hypothetical protein
VGFPWWVPTGLPNWGPPEGPTRVRPRVFRKGASAERIKGLPGRAKGGDRITEPTKRYTIGAHSGSTIWES